jgi:hypothetical protein
VAQPVPVEVVEAAVQVCGTAFHYKAQLRGVLVGSGVPGEMFDRWNADGLNKWQIARHVLTDLGGRGAAGQAVVLRVVTELANMTKPHPTAPDQHAGRQAIADLKALAAARRVLVDTDAAERAARRKEHDLRISTGKARQDAVAALSKRLADMAGSKESPQRRGYDLERWLADLFAAFELEYRPSYRSPHEQVDGAFDYKSFTYLVEARWRARLPDAGDLADFKMKVDGKLESTRGVFVSMAGFDQAVVDYFMGMARGARNNLLLVDGQDLALVVQGQVALPDALDYKIQAASQEGRWWAPLAARS